MKKKLVLTLSLVIILLFLFPTLAFADDPDTEPPTAPANLVTTAIAADSVSISWDASTDNVGVTGYDVYNGLNLVETVATTSFSFNNLSPGTSYTFGVVAKDAAENASSESTISCYTLLTTPTNTSVTPHTTSIDISWDPVTSAESYSLQINEDTITGITGTTYNYSGLTPGQSYSVSIQAVNANTTSEWSTPSAGYTLMAVPTNIATIPHTTAADISWDPVSAATSYDVRVNDETVTGITGTSYTYRGLQSGQDYTIYVRAANVNIVGEWSEAVSGTTLESTVIGTRTISSDTTWSKDDSPYVISGSVTIDQGVTLSIESGTVIKTNSSTSRTFIINGILDVT